MHAVVIEVEDVFAAIEDADMAPLLPRDSAEISTAIDWRRAGLVHNCAFGCGQRARSTIYIGANDLFGARWLDTCWPHFNAVHELATSPRWPQDNVLVLAYQVWQAHREGRVPPWPDNERAMIAYTDWEGLRRAARSGAG